MIGYGDEILCAGQAQRLYEADPTRRVGIFDINGRPRWHAIWEGNPAIARPDDATNGTVQRLVSAPHARPYIVYPFTVHTGWTFNKTFKARDHVAKIYLTERELAYGAAVRARVGPYVLIEPSSEHRNLRWPVASWKQLVRQRPDLTFVQHIHKETTAIIHGIKTIHTTFREACAVAVASRLYVRGESGMCHAAAALGVPQVTIWGGCMDWEVLGGYPGQVGLVDDGPESPCGRWLPCNHCATAMSRITVEQVSAAIQQTLAGVPHGAH